MAQKYTELDAAEAFASVHGSKFVHNPDSDLWLERHGFIWRPVHDEQVFALMIDMVKKPRPDDARPLYRLHVHPWRSDSRQEPAGAARLGQQPRTCGGAERRRGRPEYRGVPPEFSASYLHDARGRPDARAPRKMAYVSTGGLATGLHTLHAAVVRLLPDGAHARAQVCFATGLRQKWKRGAAPRTRSTDGQLCEGRPRRCPCG